MLILFLSSKMKKNKQQEYINIPLPDELAKQIENVINTAELGYKTKSEFVKEAVRERLIELGEFKGFKKKQSRKNHSAAGSRNPKLVLKKV